MFKPIRGHIGKTISMPAATAQTIVKGDALVDNGSGLLATASSSTATDIRFVAMETVTTTANGQEVLCLRTDGVTFEADVDSTWATTDVGTEADLAAAGQVNPDASTNDTFLIEKGVGATGVGTKVIGRFIQGTPNS